MGGREAERGWGGGSSQVKTWGHQSHSDGPDHLVTEKKGLVELYRPFCSNVALSCAQKSNTHAIVKRMAFIVNTY